MFLILVKKNSENLEIWFVFRYQREVTVKDNQAMEINCLSFPLPSNRTQQPIEYDFRLLCWKIPQQSFLFGNKIVSICNKEELSKPSHYSKSLKSQTPILYVTMIDNGNKNLIEYYFLKSPSTDPNFENHVTGNIHNFFWIKYNRFWPKWIH